jgi:hypothetical protein
LKVGFRDEDDELPTEPDFDALRSDSAFKEIIGEVQELRKH